MARRIKWAKFMIGTNEQRNGRPRTAAGQARRRNRRDDEDKRIGAGRADARFQSEPATTAANDATAKLGAEPARRRQKRRRLLRARRSPIIQGPTFVTLPRDHDGRCGLENEQDLLERFAAGKRIALLLLLGVFNRATNFAQLVGIECFLDRLRERHLPRIIREHPTPRECLHQIPMTSRGEEPREKRQEEGKPLAHEKSERVRKNARSVANTKW